MNKVVTLSKTDSHEFFDINGQVHHQKKEICQINPNHEIYLKEFRKEVLTIIKSLETRIEKKISILHELVNDIAAKE